MNLHQRWILTCDLQLKDEESINTRRYQNVFLIVKEYVVHQTCFFHVNLCTVNHVEIENVQFEVCAHHKE